MLLQRLLDEIQKEQNEYLRQGGSHEIADRIKRIQYLVYHFLHNIIRYLLRMGRLRETDKEFLDALVKNIRSAPAGAPTTTSAKPGYGTGQTAEDELAGDPDLINKLRDAYDSIAKLERKNHFLLELLESMKNTFEFFEFCEDQKILANGKYQDNIFKQQN